MPAVPHIPESIAAAEPHLNGIDHPVTEDSAPEGGLSKVHHLFYTAC